jgi:two-component system sensor histidine kinase ChiS
LADVEDAVAGNAELAAQYAELRMAAQRLRDLVREHILPKPRGETEPSDVQNA